MIFHPYYTPIAHHLSYTFVTNAVKITAKGSDDLNHLDVNYLYTIVSNLFDVPIRLCGGEQIFHHPMLYESGRE